jgi:hypothetical protein
MSLDKNMPPDPFNTDGVPDMTTWAATCRSMYTSLVAAGFKEAEAFEFTVRMIAAMLVKSTS